MHVSVDVGRVFIWLACIGTTKNADTVNCDTFLFQGIGGIHCLACNAWHIIIRIIGLAIGKENDNFVGIFSGIAKDILCKFQTKVGLGGTGGMKLVYCGS